MSTTIPATKPPRASNDPATTPLSPSRPCRAIYAQLPAAPGPARRRRASASHIPRHPPQSPALPESRELFYSDFMAGVAMIPRQKMPDELATDLQGLLEEYNPTVSSYVRTTFVADSRKLRTATRLVQQELNEEEVARLSAHVNQRRRDSTPNQLRRAKDRLQELMQGPMLGDGTTSVASIASLGNCQALIRILTHHRAKRPTQSVNDLWRDPDGVLYGVSYTKRALETAMQRLREADNNAGGGGVGEESEAEDNTVAAGDSNNNKDVVAGGASDNDDDDDDDNVNPVEQQDPEAAKLPTTPEIPRRHSHPRPSSPLSFVHVDKTDAPSYLFGSSPLPSPMALDAAAAAAQTPPGPAMSPHHVLDLAAISTTPAAPSSLPRSSSSGPSGPARISAGDAVRISSTSAISSGSIPPPLPPPPNALAQGGNGEEEATASISAAEPQSLGVTTQSPPNSAVEKRRAPPATFESQPSRKRHCREGPPSCRLAAGLAALDLGRLTSHECLNADVVNATINLITALCPLSVHLLDSALSDGQQACLSPATLARLPKYPNGLVVAPIHLPHLHHWILAVATAEKVHVLDSLVTQSPELTAKVLRIRRLIYSAPPESGEDAPPPEEGVIDYLACHQQDNGVDCGVAVIVNVCRLVAGQARFDVPTDFALWRRIVAALVDPVSHGQVIVNRQEFAPLASMDVDVPHLDTPPATMSLTECGAWYQAQAARLESFRASVLQQAGPLVDKCRALAGMLRDAEEVLSAISVAGRPGWQSGSGLVGTLRRQSDHFSDEVSEAVTRYRSLVRQVEQMPFNDPESVACLEKRLRWLEQLAESRRTAQDRIGRTLRTIKEDRVWLEQLEDSARGIGFAGMSNG